MDKVDVLAKRVDELEHALFNLSQRFYALESELRRRDIKQFAEQIKINKKNGATE